MKSTTDMPERQKITALLETYPLYKNVAVKSNEWISPSNFLGFTFSFVCPTDGEQTFKLKFEPASLFSRISTLNLRTNSIDEILEIKTENGQYNYLICYSGTCQYCQQYKAHFLIRTHTTPEAIYLSKVGQFPAYETKPDALLYKWLQEEDKVFYTKAVMCKSQNYGIAADAYLRRIVENEIVRIVEDLSNADLPGSTEIKTSLETYKKTHVMEKLISGTTKYMPASFDELGENPVKFLHSQLSQGIHKLSEEECLDRAEAIDTVLKWTIRKIYEETSELKKVREAIKKVKGR